MAKIALAVFFASYIVEKTELLSMASQRMGPVLVPDLRQFGPVILAAGLSLVIMTAERDIGFSLLFLTLFISMLWMATGRLAYLGVGAVLFSAGGFVASALFPHVHDRIQVWVNPWPHVHAQGYQIIQAMFAFAAGGVAGTGLGLGSPQRIPVVASDFIFAAIGEELGLVGTMAILVAFLLLVGAGLRIALAARRPFDKLLAAGLTGAIGFQAFYILAGVTRLLPLTGVTLPFVSYGGSSLVANYVLIAVLVRVSHQTAERNELEAHPAAVASHP
jgi:peptidoglycan glycosyltransferase